MTRREEVTPERQVRQLLNAAGYVTIGQQARVFWAAAPAATLSGGFGSPAQRGLRWLAEDPETRVRLMLEHFDRKECAT